MRRVSKYLVGIILLTTVLSYNSIILANDYSVEESYIIPTDMDITNLSLTQVAMYLSRQYTADKMKENITYVDLDSDVYTEINSTDIFEVPKLPKQYITYMPVSAVTSKTSNQYKLITSGLLRTDEQGFKRLGEDYCIALGSYYGTQIGTRYLITFDDGNSITAVLTDCKANIHTDKLNQYSDANLIFNGEDGNIMEIVFDTSVFSNLNYSQTTKEVNKIINNKFQHNIASIQAIGKYSY